MVRVLPALVVFMTLQIRQKIRSERTMAAQGRMTKAQTQDKMIRNMAAAVQPQQGLIRLVPDFTDILAKKAR
jgi:hypothetical protein|tara:strand:+ start:721 stop:936 length:216 start_codon:yes stop_codon:yes gene_type:complete